MTSAWSLLEFPGKQVGVMVWRIWVTGKTTIHTCSGFKQSEPLLDRHMLVFIPINVSPGPVKNIVTGTKYRLKLSVLCDLLEIILCTMGPETSGNSR